MKAIPLTAALLALVAAAAPAQAQFGIRGGVDLTRFVGKDVRNVESKTGLRMGGSLQLLSIGPVAIVPEIHYAQKGARQSGNVPGMPGMTTLDFSLDYIEVPVLAKLYLASGRSRLLRPYVAAGPAFAWNLSCEITFENANVADQVENCRGEQFQSADTAFRTADRGFVVSGGVDLGVLGIGALNLDARLIRGLTRLSEGSGEGSDMRNQALSVTLGYSFGI
jgi:hypothetical protein